MNTETRYPYATHLNVHYQPLEVVEVRQRVSVCKDRWYNQALCKVNASVVRFGVVEGECRWQKHDDEDENAP